MEMDFNCEICGKGFYYKRYLKAHEARAHSMYPQKNAKKGFPCKSCEKCFGSESSLYRHNKREHTIRNAYSVLCQEMECSEKFMNVCELRAHLSSVHKLEGFSECTNLQFSNETDFRVWLAEEEKKSNSKFISTRGKRKHQDFTYHKFNCHRSGFFKSNPERKPQRKSKGTVKIGFHCTSCIIVRYYGTHLNVDYYSKHYNHDVLPPSDPLNQVSTSSNTQETEESPNINYVELVKKDVMSLTSLLSSVDTFDKTDFEQINQHLKAIRNLLNSKTNGNGHQKSKSVTAPTNRKIICQRFYAVKKSSSNKNLKLSKPTMGEVLRSLRPAPNCAKIGNLIQTPLFGVICVKPKQ